jgi:hypothetical protein
LKVICWSCLIKVSSDGVFVLVQAVVLGFEMLLTIGYSPAQYSFRQPNTNTHGQNTAPI